MNCPSCGTKCPESANFCNRCGAQLQAPPGSLADFIRDYRKAAAEKPENPDAHYNLALAYLHAGQEELALAELKQVVCLAPDFSDAHYQLGRLQLRRGRKQEALPARRRARGLEPGNAAARRLLARLEKT